VSNHDAKETREKSKDALKAVYYVIIGLAITEGLSKIFLCEGTFRGLQVFDSSRLPYTLLLIFALMPTICRFVHGASIHLDMYSEKYYKPLLDFICFLIQASLFYMMAITLDRPLYFLVFFMGMLLFDAVWLIVLIKVKYIKFDSTNKQWLWSDSTVIFLFFLIFLKDRTISRPLSVAMICIVSMIATCLDYYMNKKFYFPE